MTSAYSGMDEGGKMDSDNWPKAPAVTPAVKPLTEVRDALHAELCWFVRRNDLNGTPPDPAREAIPPEVRLRDYALAISAVRDLTAAILNLDHVIGSRRKDSSP